MFVNMAFVSPKPEKEREMIERMQSFSKTFENAPGLLGVHILKERGDQSRTLIGISMWQDEEAFNRAMDSNRTPSSTSAQPRGASAEALIEHPTVVKQYVEV